MAKKKTAKKTTEVTIEAKPEIVKVDPAAEVKAPPVKTAVQKEEPLKKVPHWKVFAAAKKLIDSKKHTYKSLSEACGVSATVISLCIKNQYPGDYSRVASHIARWMDKAGVEY
jgi:hypothetical protein